MEHVSTTSPTVWLKRQNLATDMWFLWWLSVKNLPVEAGFNVGSILGLERSPGKGNGNPPQCSCLEIPWTEKPGRLQSVGLQKSQTQLSE